jgi:S1-C subfamily serine protease
MMIKIHSRLEHKQRKAFYRVLMINMLVWASAATVLVLAALGQRMPADKAFEMLDQSVVEFTHMPGVTRCTATMIDTNTYLTAAHCDPGTARTYIVNKDGDKVLAVSFEQAEDGADWAIVRTEEDPPGVVPLAVSCSFAVKTGEPIAYLGYPYPLERFYSEGIIVSLGVMRIDYPALPITSLHGGPGASGSAIISLVTGEIIGVLSIGVENTRGNLLGVGITMLPGSVCELG